jgi:outer membrane lipoprotein-sorting protein
MGERIEALRAYEAQIVRTTVASAEGESQTVESRFHLAWQRPNLVAFASERPEGEMRVLCDGSLLTIEAPGLGLTTSLEASRTLSGIHRQTQGLAVEGLAIGGLFFSDDPVGELIEDFEMIHDLGTARLDDVPCRLVGLEDPDGLRLILWVDSATLIPRQAVLDASSTIRDMAAAQNINSLGARVTVTETHRDVRLNPPDLTFGAVTAAEASLEAEQ